MKRVGLAVFTVLLLGSLVGASTIVSSPKVSIEEATNQMISDAATNVPAYAPGLPAGIAELDEILGDTVHVGFTYWESQHNGTCGRNIGYYNVGVPTVLMTWTCLESSNGARHVRFNRITDDGGAFVVEEPAGYIVDASNRAGYTSMAYNAADGQPFPGYHAMASADADAESQIAAEWNVFPGVFNATALPEYGEFPHIWPKVAFADYQGTPYMHSVTSMSREDDASAAMEILYSRAEYNAATYSFVAPEEQVLVTDNGMNISADVAVNDDGSMVAIAQTWSRDYEYHPEDDPSQMNNDIMLWISTDGGTSWDWDNPINVTDFAMPNPDFLPDSLAADVDTFRAYTDVNVYIDHENIVHVAFTAPGYFFYEGTITYTAYIFHWDNATNDVSVLADGTFWNFVQPGAWQRQVGRPSMYQDPETKILWCVFQSYGEEGWYDPVDSTQYDRSDDGFSNGEIMVVASPPNGDEAGQDWYGHLWTKPVNITNSWGTNGEQTPNNQLVAGECRNEREPTLSLNNDGAYLHINYVLDLDAGFVVQEEGEYTNNPVVYHRVAKLDLMDAFDGWVRNYPMHADSAGYWHDPYDFAWVPDGTNWTSAFFRGEDTGVDESENLQPSEFELSQNYPNPFNPTTMLNFSLAKRGHVQLAVYDVLGREVATLVNRSMSPGQHAVTFDGSSLASGVYFVKMTSGNNTKSIKMVLMK